MFNIDWTDADMIFANSTCFDQAMMENIYEQSLRCKKGTWMITTTNKLPYAEKVLSTNQNLNQGASAAQE